MSNVNDGPKSGQVSVTSAPRLTLSPEMVEAANRDLDAVSAIIDLPGDEEAPSTERRGIPPVPFLALRHDGRVLLEVNSDVSEEDLAGRTVARYVELSEAQALDALDCVQDGFSNSAARAVWSLARPRLGYPPKPSEEQP